MESSAIQVTIPKRSFLRISSVSGDPCIQRRAPIGNIARAFATRGKQVYNRSPEVVKGNLLRREFLPAHKLPNLAARQSGFFGQGGARRLAGATGATRTVVNVRSRVTASSFKTDPGAVESGPAQPADGAQRSENGALADSNDVEVLRAALQAAEQRANKAAKEKGDVLQALQDAEKRIEEYAANMIATAEEAMKEVEGAKATFRAELDRVTQEKREVEAKLMEAQSDAVQLAVRVEEMAVSAIKERSEASAEDANLRIAQAQAMAADAKVAVEQRIRKAADDAAAAVINEARVTIEDALAAASLAQQQARTAEAALKDNMDVLNKLAQAEADVGKAEQARARLESELSVVHMEVDRLRDEVVQAEARAKSAEARIAAAEAAVLEIQQKSEEVARKREKELEGALETFKLAAQAKEDAVRIAYENENEKLRKATEAAQNAARMKETSWERRYRALEQALRASEQQVEAWRARAVAVEELMKQVKAKGFDVLREAGEARDLFNGGRMSNMLLSDSQRWELLANGPRRDSPFNVPKYGLPPRSSLPVIEDVPVELPSPDSVWSIADFVVPQVKPAEKQEVLTKQVEDRVAIEKERARLERRMARIKREKMGESDAAGTDDTWESGTGSGEEIVFQGFHWESHRFPWYEELAAKAGDLAECGFTTVWLPPPTESVAPQGYMPVDFYNLNSAYGSVESLKRCIEEMHEAKIQVLGDVVLNHRCASKQSPDGTWNIFGGKLAWGPNAIVRDDPNFKGQGNPSSGDFFHAAPNIDHSQEFVRKDIKEWLEWLRKDIGYDGWRLDFVRGFWGGYVKEYIESSKPSFAIGEYWDSLAYENGQVCYNQDAHRQRIINWINATGGTASAFDVTTKGILHSALHNEYWRLIDPQGKPPGVMGWWPSRAVTFLENHDTGSTQGHWPFPRDKLLQGYAYILTHPGTPTVFYDHLYDFGMHDQIADLLKARIRSGIKCRSPVRILHATMEGYAAVIEDRLCMKIGHLDWSPAKENNLQGRWGRTLDRGTDYQVWEKER